MEPNKWHCQWDYRVENLIFDGFFWKSGTQWIEVAMRLLGGKNGPRWMLLRKWEGEDDKAEGEWGGENKESILIILYQVDPGWGGKAYS